MSSCRTIRTDSRIRSTPSPARNASSSSDTADWDNAIGGLLFSVCLAFPAEEPADGPSASAGHAVDHPKPHHARGLTPAPAGSSSGEALLLDPSERPPALAAYGVCR